MTERMSGEELDWKYLAKQWRGAYEKLEQENAFLEKQSLLVQQDIVICKGKNKQILKENSELEIEIEFLANSDALKDKIEKLEEENAELIAKNIGLLQTKLGIDQNVQSH